MPPEARGLRLYTFSSGTWTDLVLPGSHYLSWLHWIDSHSFQYLTDPFDVQRVNVDNRRSEFVASLKDVDRAVDMFGAGSAHYRMDLRWSCSTSAPTTSTRSIGRRLSPTAA